MSLAAEEIARFTAELEANVLPPWHGRDIDGFLQAFVADLQHIRDCVKGTADFEGLQEGTVAVRARQVLELVLWITVRKEIAGLHALASRTRLQALHEQSRSIGQDGRGDPKHLGEG